MNQTDIWHSGYYYSCKFPRLSSINQYWCLSPEIFSVEGAQRRFAGSPETDWDRRRAGYIYMRTDERKFDGASGTFRNDKISEEPNRIRRKHSEFCLTPTNIFTDNLTKQPLNRHDMWSQNSSLFYLSQERKIPVWLRSAHSSQDGY